MAALCLMSCANQISLNLLTGTDTSLQRATHRRSVTRLQGNFLVWHMIHTHIHSLHAEFLKGISGSCLVGEFHNDLFAYHIMAPVYRGRDPRLHFHCTGWTQIFTTLIVCIKTENVILSLFRLSQKHKLSLSHTNLSQQQHPQCYVVDLSSGVLHVVTGNWIWLCCLCPPVQLPRTPRHGTTENPHRDFLYLSCVVVSPLTQYLKHAGGIWTKGQHCVYFNAHTRHELLLTCFVLLSDLFTWVYCS